MKYYNTGSDQLYVPGHRYSLITKDLPTLDEWVMINGQLARVKARTTYHFAFEIEGSNAS